MDLKFRVFAYISKPVHEVFEAVADPAKLSQYFTTGGAKGRLETGATVTWDFHDFPGAFPVWVQEVVPDELSGHRDDDLQADRRRAHDGRDRRGRLARHSCRAQGELWQLHGLGADGRGAQGLDRARHQHARGDVQVS